MEKKKRTEVQLCYPFEERRLLEPKFGWTFPVICQPKLDGIRCRAVCTGKSVVLFSSTGSIITSVPHINEELSVLRLTCELDGELYQHQSSFENISSIISRTVNSHENAHLMQFHIFDQVNTQVQLERLTTLHSLIPTDNPVLHSVPCKVARSFKEILVFYELFLSLGYEGIIIRHRLASYERKRSRFVLKFKPKKSDVYKIVGWNQMIDKNGDTKPLLGALTCSSDEGTHFNVGSGMTNAFRQEAWKDPETLLDRYCKINYQHLTTKSVPRFPIFVEILDENPEDEISEETLEGLII